METVYYPDTLYELDPGPWRKDPESHVWCTRDGKVAIPAWEGPCITWNRWKGERVETTQKRKAKLCKVSQNIKHKKHLVCAGGFVHGVVARAWVPNPDGKPFVHHKDHDPTNNHADNLAWVTNSENVQAAYDAGRFAPRPRNHLGQFV